ncbi:hypothetical protein AVEN_256685-1 [Araneus ventricosus]|uniref:Uncharacterized protein n=1 Tax=Araneus ventricosus TaxID=182803 RepID=A0A4Y2EHZ3_ARAVE|nr:hypothetical protein AVEN_256685-1 [Araneus ventricosus]
MTGKSHVDNFLKKKKRSLATTIRKRFMQNSEHHRSFSERKQTLPWPSESPVLIIQRSQRFMKPHYLQENEAALSTPLPRPDENNAPGGGLCLGERRGTQVHESMTMGGSGVFEPKRSLCRRMTGG